MLNLVVHYAINIGSLGGWAGGSIFLILNTYYTTYMTMFSAMLMLGEPSFMMAPYNFRLTIFVASTVTVSLFMGNIATIFFKYTSGQTPTDTISDIVNLYFLILEIGAFVPSLFVFLFDGLAFSPYSIFNRKYGNWDDVVIPGQQERDQPEDDTW